MQSFFVFGGGGTISGGGGTKASFRCLFSGGVINSRRIFLKGPSVVNFLCEGLPFPAAKTVT